MRKLFKEQIWIENLRALIEFINLLAFRIFFFGAQHIENFWIFIPSSSPFKSYLIFALHFNLPLIFFFNTHFHVPSHILTISFFMLYFFMLHESSPVLPLSRSLIFIQRSAHSLFLKIYVLFLLKSFRSCIDLASLSLTTPLNHYTFCAFLPPPTHHHHHLLMFLTFGVYVFEFLFSSLFSACSPPC